MKNFIKEFRQYSKDNEKPYFFAEKEIQNSVNTALKFYSNPDNVKKFREWHLKTYGCLPEQGGCFND
jgi:hypothetical protein